MGQLAGIRQGMIGAVVALWAAVAQADTHTDLTVVWVSGDRTKVHSMAALRALDPVTLTTSTPWTDSAQRFEGVPLARLLGSPRPGDGTLRLVALNDYVVEMPLADVGDTLPIVAYSRDGQPMSIRDKGPYWVIYPFDDSPDHRSETHFSRSVWQLVRIEVHP
ncbi:oxidoreductase [Rhodobaculum claviforme]|uniref:Oxidoreductase molybdopterin-binding domain-containing protein n=1 Tax=Rhodobaculum claviforme TaxID=1549854 RepID=A0A934WIU2_9RHOB|nr:oxidoreductase [Rhodobaculum claviforme]MBK5927316.1 hypothetical protein [Rhodobaculum claviforme]